MPDISSIGHGSLGPIERAPRIHTGYAPTSRTTTNGTHNGHVTDRVEVSPHALLMQRLHELPEVRVELIERVRERITGGSYDSPDVIDAVIDRLIDDLR